MKNIIKNGIRGISHNRIQWIIFLFTTIILSVVLFGSLTAVFKTTNTIENYRNLDKFNKSHYQLDFSNSDLNALSPDVLRGETAGTESYGSLQSLIYNEFLNSFIDNVNNNPYLQKNHLSLDATLRIIRTIADNGNTFMVTPYIYQDTKNYTSRQNNNINLLEGRTPTNNNEIDVSPYFAHTNHLKVGDTYKIQGTNYKIVGFATSPDMLFPRSGPTNLVPDQKHQALIFCYQDAFAKGKFSVSSTQNQSVYALFGIKNGTSQFNFDNLSNILQNTIRIGNANLDSGDKGNSYSSWFHTDPGQLINKNDDISNIISARILFWDKVKKYLVYITITIVIIVAATCCYLLVLITSKQVLSQRKQIAILVALGYPKRRIIFSYLIPPTILFILGTFVGVFLGLFISYEILNVINTVFMLPTVNIYNETVLFSSSDILLTVGIFFGAIAFLILCCTITFVSVSRMSLIKNMRR